MCAYRRNCCARLPEERLAAGPTGGVAAGSMKGLWEPGPTGSP